MVVKEKAGHRCALDASRARVGADRVAFLALQEGNKVFSGGADNAGRMFDVATGQATQVAQHDMPIKAVRWIDAPQAGILATASWDKTIKVRHGLVCE